MWVADRPCGLIISCLAHRALPERITSVVVPQSVLIPSRLRPSAFLPHTLSYYLRSSQGSAGGGTCLGVRACIFYVYISFDLGVIFFFRVTSLHILCTSFVRLCFCFSILFWWKFYGFNGIFYLRFCINGALYAAAVHFALVQTLIASIHTHWIIYPLHNSAPIFYFYYLHIYSFVHESRTYSTYMGRYVHPFM